MRNLTTLGVLTLAVLTAAQSPTAYPGWHEGSTLNGPFDPNRVFVFSGKVIGVDVSAPRSEVAPGVAILIRLGDGRSALVELGPLAYLEQRGARPRMGEVLDFAGSKVFDGYGTTYLASRIKRGRVETTLRSVEGRPLWAN